MSALRLKRRQTELAAGTYTSRCQRLETRLDALIATPWKDKQAKRLLKRFRRHRDHLFTFLYDPAVRRTTTTANELFVRQ
jgi:hypothetical protein